MLGAAYMIWNDMCGRLDLGLSEYDLYERFEQPLPVLSAKLWGMNNSGGGRGSAEAGEKEPGADVQTESYEDFCERARMTERQMYGIEGETNRIYDDKAGLEPSYEVNLRIWLEEDPAESTAADDKSLADAMPVQETGVDQSGKSGQKEKNGRYMPQIIAESDSAYGVWAFYAVEPETGRVGFAREGRTYTWDYVLPRGQWVTLRVAGESGQTTLYADGVKVGTLGNAEPFEEYATFVFPVQRIGEETGRFRGEVEMVSRR